MAAVRFDSVRMTFPNGVDVIHEFNLEVAAGEFLTFVGPSGCGKSTLLNLLAGFEQPTGGRIFVDGERVDHKSPRERDLAMVFQSYALYPHLTVAGNIAFPLRVAKKPLTEIERRVRETADRLQLGELLDRLPRDLSGGQRQRVALARALVRRPRLCLFDEPLSNLDASLRSQMRAEIKKLHEELDATFIYVTHDQAEAMTLSDRVVVLNRGRAEQVGPPLEVYDRPDNVFVASFIGSPAINFLTPADAGLSGEVPEGARIGIRPERMTVVAAAAGRIVGPVWVTEPVGSETWVTIDLAGGRIVAKAAPHARYAAGEPVGVSFEPADLHVFDAAGGRSRATPAR